MWKEFKNDLRQIWYQNSYIVYLGIVFLAILIFVTLTRVNPK